MSDSQFNPNNVQLVASNLYLWHINNPKMGMGEELNLTFSTKVRHFIAPIDNKTGLVSVHIEAYISLDKYETAGYAIGSNFGFLVKDSTKFIQETKVKEGVLVEIDKGLEQTLASLSYSTLRGISIPTLSQTAFRGLYLPCVHADQILAGERIPLNELMEALKPMGATK